MDSEFKKMDVAARSKKEGCSDHSEFWIGALSKNYLCIGSIEENWDDMLRLMVTILRKDVTASLILNRLSSYAKHHPLYRAQKEFGRIIKSIFILNCIDDVELRQGSEKRLNIGELSNKFSKAISFGNNQEMQYSSKEEQEVVVGSQGLIRADA